MAGIEAQRPELALEVQHLVLRLLHVVFEVVELAGKPLRYLLGGIEARLEAALDVGLNDLVDDVGPAIP